jgi:hypothetical protein
MNIAIQQKMTKELPIMAQQGGQDGKEIHVIQV